MIIFKSAADISHWVAGNNSLKKGFVPTMGALHEGHLSLIKKCRESNDITICSIFINPTQFNNENDFRLYPVTLEKDISRLIEAGCDVLFLPPLTEIYPPGYEKPVYDLGAIESLLEGAHRPGHFQGVCQVVDRLLEIIKPSEMFLGQKDYQQCMVIARLLELTGRKEKLRLNIIPTMRESSGLAMSSRNLRLSEEDRERATAIFHTLNEIRKNSGIRDTRELEQNAATQLTNKGFIVDYVSVADRNTLEPAADATIPSVALIAATISDVRLIDNMLLD
jgi:pantoate--beta-alanine ligase